MKTQESDNSFSFEVLYTEDGSPSVRLWKPNQPAQCMHHLGGALSESLFIYLEATKKALSQKRPPRILSVGLGLGYNELLTLAEVIKFYPELKEELFLVSYESEPLLRQALFDFLNGNETHPAWDELYEKILIQIAKEFDLSPEELRLYAQKTLKNGQWQIRKTLNAESIPKEVFSVVYFDAFSSSATPDLWTEDFLKKLLTECTEELTLFVTYAVTGNLKRSLKNLNFEIANRSGFKGKRESTWSVRKDQNELFKQFLP